MSAAMSDVGEERGMSGSATAAAAAAAASASAASAPLPPSARYTYAVTAQPPTLVTHTAVCSFTGRSDRNLLLVRSTRLEVYRVSEEGGGLESLMEVPIYGRVTALVVLQAKNESTARLFISTERHKFFVLRYDADTKEIVTVATGDSKLKIGRVSDQGCLALLDPSNSWIALHQYAGLVQILPVGADGALGREIHECKLETLQVLQMVWLHAQSKPTLLVLAKDDEGTGRCLRSFSYEAREKELRLAPGAINVPRCEAGAAQVIPTDGGGVVLVAEQMLIYYPPGGQSSVHLPVVPWVCVAWCRVDSERFLLGDIEGGLHALLLEGGASAGAVKGMRLEFLGVTSIAHRIQYVDNSLVLIGSQYGDSQLIKLHRTPQPLPGEEEEEDGQDAAADATDMEVDGGAATARPAASSAADAAATPKRPNFITIESTFEHLGPIVDFEMLDLERNGQGAMLTCSGSYKDGSLRLVRNGIGVREEAAIELPGIQGVWSLADENQNAAAAAPGEEAHRLLVQTFATETRILALEPDEEGGEALQLAECEVAGFDAAQRTLHCANLDGGLILQVTQNSCRIADAKSFQLVDEWRAPPAAGTTGGPSKLTVAASNPTQVLVAAGRVLILLAVQDRKLVLQRQVVLEHEISSLDITPLPGASSAAFVAVCTWHSHIVSVRTTATLDEVSRERLGETVARSVLLAHFDAGTPDATSYLMCGLGDGQLISFEIHPTTAKIVSRKQITLGTSGLELRLFYSHRVLHVFASCDRPTVVSCSGGKLLYSNVNVSEGVSHMASFHAPGVFHHCLALASSTQLTIAHVDDIQKLHIKTVRTDGQPRRLAQHKSSHTVAVAVVERCTGEPAPDDLVGELHKIKLFDDEHFTLHDTLTLHTNEAALTITSMRLDTNSNAVPASTADAAGAASASASSLTDPSWPEYLVVGTGYINPDEPEPSTGRLLVLLVDTTSGRPSLRLVSSAAIRGAVLKVASLQGRIIAGVNARVVVYRCVSSTQVSSALGEFRLEKRCDYLGNVLVLALSVSHDQQYILVGDLMNGVRVLHYQQHANVNGVQSAATDCSLSEVARHYESTWLTALDSFSQSDDVCVMADHHHNLLTLRRQMDAQSEDERSRMECIGRWHCGELINKIARGSLIMQMPTEPDTGAGSGIGAGEAAAASSTSSGVSSVPVSSSSSSSSAPFPRVVPTHLYGTLEGGIGVLAPLSPSAYKFFARLEEELERALRSVGNLSHREWRAFHTERRSEESSGVIDGDLVEKFLLLSQGAQEAIAAKVDVTLAECIRRVEEVQRIH